jgi:hypothetical protein
MQAEVMWIVVMLVVQRCGQLWPEVVNNDVVPPLRSHGDSMLCEATFSGG